jgi:hypothetical protein
MPNHDHRSDSTELDFSAANFLICFHSGSQTGNWFSGAYLFL